MKKSAKVILVSVLVLLIGAVVSVFLFLNQIVHKGVETGGPKLLGVTTTLEEVDLHPFRGRFLLRDLVIGSPEGFKADHTFRLDSIVVDLDVGTVTEDTIVIRSVTIESPDIIYELGLGGSNLGQLMKNIETNTGGAPAAEEPAETTPAETDAAPGRKVIVENLVIDNGSIRVAAKALSGPGITMPLPRIHLKDIGKEDEGASLPVVVARVFKAITTTVLQTAASSGKLAGTGLKAGAEAALKGAQAGAELVGQGAGLATGAAGKATEAVGKGLQEAGAATGQAGAALGRGAGAATDAATKGVGAAAGAAGKAGATVGKGAAKVVGGITGLFGKDRRETEEAATNAQEEATAE